MTETATTMKRGVVRGGDYSLGKRTTINRKTRRVSHAIAGIQRFA
jgi:hypothetical protein